MSENKSCGNCKHFKYEDAIGIGVCNILNIMTQCNTCCGNHDTLHNDWTEITPDNVDMIDDGSIVIVTDGTYYNKASEWHLSIGTMAKYGGYYYYVLPELKIE
jgi:hypothetical protein